MSKAKEEWKDTLQLPQTGFPMKAQLNLKEPEIIKKWQEADIYQRILAKRAGRPSYILHDGPPYANGKIHLGTAFNKILKDMVVKSKSMENYHAPYVPGWDCHGLPIEIKVDKLLGKKKEKMDIIALRQECRKYAEKYLDLQRQDFIRLGVFGEWHKPYTTLDPQYEATIIRYFNSFVGKGNVYRKKRPVHWCISCQTALAEAEVEYHDHTSPSIYVKFPLLDVPDVLRPFQGKEMQVLIWTTTPWTIPANLAIALHPEFDYALFQLKDEYLIAATRLIPVIAELAGAPYHKLAEFKGTALAGSQARHPLYPERPSLLINTDYVLLDQGTGCVHTAPGHGDEDYQAGIQFHLDIYSPVDGSGRFDSTTGKYQGQVVFAANDQIVSDLAEKGRLLHTENIVHSYPHCWRCKNPVIFRATEQWFIAMDTAQLRQKSLTAIRQVTWLPKWGEERIYSMIENRPDWCISRQRDWGVPLPVFFCQKCQQPLLDQAAIEKVAKVFASAGSNSWYQKAAKEFLPAGTACPGCGHSEFEKSRDIIDVWFESGASHGILDLYPKHSWPADLYLEGNDQFRGWFHSSLLVGISAKEAAPYRTVISHGFVLDENGRAMSKSLGNVIEPQTIISENGAEILRLWVAMLNYQEDVRWGEEIRARLVESYRKIRNTWRFMLGVLADFSPNKDSLPETKYSLLDRYILHRFGETKKKAVEGYRSFEYFSVFHTMFNFFTVDLSAFYLNIQKDNLYCNTPNSSPRRGSQTVIFRLLEETLRLMAPILSFTSEEAWAFVPEFAGKEPYVHLCSFPENEAAHLDANEEKAWTEIMRLRDSALKEIEEARNRKTIGDSLEADIRIELPGEILALLQRHSELLREILIVSRLEILAGESERITVSKAAGKKCPRCWNWFNAPDELCPRCAAVAAEKNR